MTRLGFAIVGCGHIAKKHAQAIAATDGAYLAAVCDTAPDRMEPYINEYQATGYTSFDEMLADPGVDVVCLCTPSGLHAQMGIEAARRGKHLVVEKPIALTLQDADNLIRAAADHKVKLTVVHPNRFRPAIQGLRRKLEQGAFGKLTHGNATVRWNRNQAYFDKDAWRGTRDMDGGVLMNQAIHNIDLLQWMMGPVREVFAYTTTRLRQIETEDLSVAVLKFANGALGVVEAAVTVYPKNLEETVSIFGETGTAVIGGVTVSEVKAWYFAGVNDEESKRFMEKIAADPLGKPGHQIIIEDMVQAVQEGREPLITGEEARKSLEIILAIYRSVETGQPVVLPLEKSSVKSSNNNVIHRTVKQGRNCKIGDFTVIMENVEIGDRVTIGNNVTIYPGTKIGSDVIIADNSVLGKQPRPAKTSTVKLGGLLPPLEIGSGTTVGTSAILYAGSRIGDNSLIADLASVRESCTIGNYVIIGRGVAVENHVVIGDYTKVQTGAYITAHTTIEDHVFIGPMVTTTNDNFMGRTEERFNFIKGPHIERGARLGGASITLPGVRITSETFVATGSLITKNTKEKTLYKGLPAKEVRQVPQEELLEGQEKGE